MNLDQAHRDLLKHFSSIVRTAVSLDEDSMVTFREDKRNTLRGLLLNDNLTKENADHIVLFVDGACRGNPGPGATASILISGQTGRVLSKVCKYVGHCTNNRTEFIAAANGLEKAVQLRAKKVDLMSDSELLVGVLQGTSVVKDTHLLQEMLRLERAKAHLTQFQATKIHRADNFVADLMANLVLDLRA